MEQNIPYSKMNQFEFAPFLKLFWGGMVPKGQLLSKRMTLPPKRPPPPPPQNKILDTPLPNEY